MNALIYDIEILAAVPPKDPAERKRGVQYCQGWKDFAGMGISCIGAYDYKDDRYRVFTRGNFSEFSKLCEDRDLLVGFNSIAFDNEVIAAFFNEARIQESKCYDILREVWIASSLGIHFNYPSHAGFSLDACCKENFGTFKTGNGATAPADWQAGQYGKVIDYCVNDVKLTKQLFDMVLAKTPIKSPKDSGKMLTLRVPV